MNISIFLVCVRNDLAYPFTFQNLAFANCTSIFLHVVYVRNVSRTKTAVSVTSKTRLSPQAAVSTFMRTSPNVTPLRQTGRCWDVIKQVRGIFQDLRERMPGRTRFVLLTIVGWQYLVWHYLWWGLHQVCFALHKQTQAKLYYKLCDCI